MAALTASLALLALARVPLAEAQAFGRFGYTRSPSMGGFRLDATGFVADAPRADTFKFVAPSKMWRPAFTSARKQIVLLSGSYRRPAKLRLDLACPGPEFYFENGAEFQMDSLGAPFLSWSEGSVGEGVPTPSSRWVLVSFKSAQPPVLLVVPDGDAAFAVRGKPGAWRIVTEGDFHGWIRAVLPCGTESIPTPSASALGRLCERLTRGIDAWIAPTPELIGVDLQADLDSVTAVYRYSGRGAIVPMPLGVAAEAGYPIQVSPRLRQLDGATGEGPRYVLDDRFMKVRFPIRRIPNGRALAVGDVDLNPPSTLSPLDLESVVELALANLAAARDAATRTLAEDTLSRFLSEADYQKEPFTGQQHPFLADGQGADLAAAHALLMQSLGLSVRTDSGSNALLSSLSWRRDGYTWLIPCADASRSRRATALAAAAGAMCPEPERRFEAAMMQCGLVADDWRRKRTATPLNVDPLRALRTTVFSLRTVFTDPFAEALMSPVRVFGSESFRAKSDAKGVVLEWDSVAGRPDIVTLASAYSVRVENVNLKSLEVSSAMGFYSLKYTPVQAGPCQIRLIFPVGAPKLPKAAAPGPYSDFK